MENYFSNKEELYKRVKPVLRMQKEKLEKEGYKIIEEDIWNDLIKKKWINSHNLTLYEMISDIFSYSIN